MDIYGKIRDGDGKYSEKLLNVLRRKKSIGWDIC